MPEPNEMGTRIRVRSDLEPIDVLFFRDARPFEIGSRATSGLPMPQTVAGAIRTLLADLHGIPIQSLGGLLMGGLNIAEAFASLGEMGRALGSVRLRGPWLSRDGDLLVPMPMNLRRNKHDCTIVRLDPLQEDLPGWEPLIDGMAPLWRRGRKVVEGIEGYLSLAGLRRFLEGGVPEIDDVVLSKDLYGFSDRTGIGVDEESGAAEDGQIFSVRFLSLMPGIRFALECEGPEELLRPLLERPVLMRLGGEGRQVRVRSQRTEPMWDFRRCRGADGRLLLLTTPAPFDGWYPSALKSEVLAAAVGGHLAVSGWDLATGGPKPNRFLVPAGSVYFLRREPARADEFPPARDLVEKPDASLGWGCFVEGCWNYA